MADIETITLTNGNLRFSARAAGEGPLVLLVHGFPDDFHSFDAQIGPLAAAGYRVVAPMLRGYEPGSQSPRDLYHLIHLASDVFAWMDCLGARQCHLVGHDWGALTSYVATALQPKRFASLTTLAIPHLRRSLMGVAEVPGQLVKSSYILLMQFARIAEHIVARDDYAFVETLWKLWSPDWQYTPEQLEQVKQTFRSEGVVHAATQYYRCLLQPLSLSTQQSWRMLTAPVTVPTLALTGEHDGCMDTRLYDTLMREQDFEGGLMVRRLPDTGHFLHREAPAEVNSLLLDWLSRHPAR
ncbi:MAG TPA: alpha/beta hydrolase [Moraxellaceae bacterium]|nr:alpha/beta hydrolase [Moraxellaceae bacterium]